MTRDNDLGRSAIVVGSFYLVCLRIASARSEETEAIKSLSKRLSSETEIVSVTITSSITLRLKSIEALPASTACVAKKYTDAAPLRFTNSLVLSAVAPVFMMSSNITTSLPVTVPSIPVMLTAPGWRSRDFLNRQYQSDFLGKSIGPGLPPLSGETTMTFSRLSPARKASPRVAGGLVFCRRISKNVWVDISTSEYEKTAIRFRVQLRGDDRIKTRSFNKFCD